MLSALLVIGSFLIAPAAAVVLAATVGWVVGRWYGVLGVGLICGAAVSALLAQYYETPVMQRNDRMGLGSVLVMGTWGAGLISVSAVLAAFARLRPAIQKGSE